MYIRKPVYFVKPTFISYCVFLTTEGYGISTAEDMLQARNQQVVPKTQVESDIRT
jgi:hypothetical protein